MDDEKRMIQNYEVINAIHIDNKEFILAEDLTSSIPYMVCECKWDDPMGRFDNAVAGNDYLEAMDDFLGRTSTEMQRIRDQRAERGISSEPLTAADCIPGSRSADCEYQLIVIRPESMVPSARTADMQLLLSTDGFGCDPNASGRAVMCKNLITGKTSRWDREDIAGIVLPERVPEWAHQRLRDMGISPLDHAPTKVYMDSVEDAQQKGKVEAFHISHKLNVACARGIDKAISESYKGDYRYDLPAALHAVTAEYGAERVQMVLANTLQQKRHDGRFSDTNQDWARSIPMPQQNQRHRSPYVCETHSAILDGFINAVHRQEKEKKPSIKEKLKAPSKPTTPTTQKKEKKHDDKGR